MANIFPRGSNILPIKIVVCALVLVNAVSLGIKSGEIRREDAPLVVALFVACSMGLSLFAAAVVGSSLPDIVGVFNTLIDGDLFRKVKRK